MKKKEYQITCPYCKKDILVRKKRNFQIGNGGHSVFCPECKKIILLFVDEAADTVEVFEPKMPEGYQTVRILTVERKKEK